MNLKWRKAVIVALTVVTVASVTGCGGLNSETASAGGEAKPYHLRIGYSPSLCQSALFAAYENGYFKEEGLDPEMVQIDAAHAGDAIAADQVDVLQGLASKMVQPLENGLPVKVTGGLHTGCIKILVPKDSPIKSVEDLKGKKVGVSGLADSATMIAKRALSAKGVGVTEKNMEVEFSVFSRNDLPQALQKGAVDAIAVTDPVGPVAAKQYGLRTILDTAKDAPFKDEYCCVSMVTTKLAKENPEVAEKATRAILRGAAWVQAHPDEAVKLGLDKKYVAGNQELNASLIKSYSFKPSVQGGYDALKACTEELAKIGLVKADTNAQKLTDDSFQKFKGLEDSPSA